MADKLQDTTSQQRQPILTDHDNSIVPRHISDHDSEIVQLNVWTGEKWAAIFDGNDFNNLKIDLHKVAKVVDAQVDNIDKVVKKSNDAVDKANQAVNDSIVNKTAIDAMDKAVKEAQGDMTKIQAGNSELSEQIDKVKATVNLKLSSADLAKELDSKGYATETFVQNNIQAKADSLSSTITDLSGKVDQNGKLISSNTAAISNITQSIDGIQTTVKQNADDANTQLTQLANQITSKVSSKDYNTEIAQLNNAINLRVSKGDVISQINEEAGGPTLIQVADGKGKLYLDADSVIFSNRAFIPSAAITEIEADKITSGTLDAGQMRVINLTADVIHGGTLDVGNMNVKNFSANDIKTGTLSGIEIKAGTDTDYFDLVGQNIYWKRNEPDPLLGVSIPGSSIIGQFSDNQFEFNQDFPGALTIADINELRLSLYALSGEIDKNGKQVYVPRITDQPKIVLTKDDTIDANHDRHKTGSLKAQSQATIWVDDKEYMQLTRHRGFLMHLDDTTGLTGPGADKPYYKTSTFNIQKDNKIGAYFGGGDNGNNIQLVTGGGGSVIVNSDFNVTGNKNAIVNTSQGYVAISAYETAEYYFGDIGESNTGKTGKVTIGIDKVFNETVNTDITYQVFLTSYSNARLWVSERDSNRFIVQSDVPNAEFGWEIKAKRKGYEDNRLRHVNADIKPSEVVLGGK